MLCINEADSIVNRSIGQFDQVTKLSIVKTKNDLRFVKSVLNRSIFFFLRKKSTVFHYESMS